MVVDRPVVVAVADNKIIRADKIRNIQQTALEFILYPRNFSIFIPVFIAWQVSSQKRGAGGSLVCTAH